MYSVFSRVESVGPDEHDPAGLVVRLAPMPGLVDPTLRIARDHIDGYLAVVGVTSASDLIGLSVRVSVAPDDSTEHIAFLPATRPADASQGFLVLRDSRPANQVTVYDLVGYAPPVAPVPAAGSFGATSGATPTANETPDQAPTGSAAEETPAGGATAGATTAGADAVVDDADVAAAYAVAFGSATAGAATEAVTSADGTAGVAPSDAAADAPSGDAIGQAIPDVAANAIDTPTEGDAGATEVSAVTPESPTDTTGAGAETAPSSASPSANPSASPVPVEDECPEAAPKLTPEDQEAEERARAEIATTAQQPVGQRYFLYRETYGKSAHGAAIELTPEEFAALGGPAYVHLEDCGIANMQFIPADVAQDIERLLARTIMRPETELSRSDVEHLAANGRVVSVAVY